MDIRLVIQLSILIITYGNFYLWRLHNIPLRHRTTFFNTVNIQSASVVRLINLNCKKCLNLYAEHWLATIDLVHISV